MKNEISDLFKNQKADPEKLTAFGFVSDGTSYVYHELLPGSGFRMTVTVDGKGDVAATVIDPITEEPYILHLIENAAGSFVGEIRAQYESVLTKIVDACFTSNVFRFAQTEALIAYVRQKYGDELEFLWGKYPDAAVWRRKDSKKWYGLLMTISKRKLGLSSDEAAEVLDLRIPSHESADIVDGIRYFPGYHMNKKHWYTIVLDGSVSFTELCGRIDDSYTKAVK